MRKKIISFAVIIAFCLLLCYLVIGNPLVFLHNQELQQAVLLIDDDVKEITLNEVVPFAWDAVYTFSPYTSKEEIEAIIGFKSSSIRETVNEGMVQLLFVENDSVVASICGYPDNLGYSVSFSDVITYEEEAVFSVSKEAGKIILRR